jgi:hypothetical protein
MGVLSADRGGGRLSCWRVTPKRRVGTGAGRLAVLVIVGTSGLASGAPAGAGVQGAERLSQNRHSARARSSSAE